MNPKHSAGSRESSGSPETLAADTRLDRTDRLLLKRLQADGRRKLSQLAEDVHLSLSACSERVKWLESQGYIDGYFAHLKPERLGLGLLAYIQVSLDKTTPDALDRFKDAMIAFDEVMECHLVGGGFDALIKVRVKDMNAYWRFLGKQMGTVQGVHQTHTYFVMQEVKSSHRLAVPG